MKPYLVVLLALLPGAPGFATSIDDVIVAAMRLGEQRNYSWATSVTDDARSYETAGKTTEGGYTWVRLPMVESLARRLGRAAEPDIEALFSDPDHCVIRTDGHWRWLEELPRRHPDWTEENYWPATHGSLVLLRPGPGSSIGFHDPLDPFANDPFPPLLIVPAPMPEEGHRPHSNAQFALSHPHEELAVIVSSHATMEIRGNRAAGMLTDLGAQLLLVREGQDRIEPVTAGGLYELTIQNGIVTKYALRLEGILYVDRKRVHVRQISCTTLHRIGATVLEVPEEARRMLEGRRLLAGMDIKR